MGVKIGDFWGEKHDAIVGFTENVPGVRYVDHSHFCSHVITQNREFCCLNDNHMRTKYAFVILLVE